MSRWTTCPGCGGSGTVIDIAIGRIGFPICSECDGSGIEIPYDPDDGMNGDMPCPSCGGRGVLITDELREDVAAALRKSDNPGAQPFKDEYPSIRDDYLKWADAALVAVVEKLKENQ